MGRSLGSFFGGMEAIQAKHNAAVNSGNLASVKAFLAEHPDMINSLAVRGRALGMWLVPMGF